MFEDIQIWISVKFWTNLFKIKPIKRIWVGLRLVSLAELADGDDEHLLGLRTLIQLYMDGLK